MNQGERAVRVVAFGLAAVACPILGIAIVGMLIAGAFQGFSDLWFILAFIALVLYLVAIVVLTSMTMAAPKRNVTLSLIGLYVPLILYFVYFELRGAEKAAAVKRFLESTDPSEIAQITTRMHELGLKSGDVSSLVRALQSSADEDLKMRIVTLAEDIPPCHRVFSPIVQDQLVKCLNDAALDRLCRQLGKSLVKMDGYVLRAQIDRLRGAASEAEKLEALHLIDFLREFPGPGNSSLFDPTVRDVVIQLDKLCNDEADPSELCARAASIVHSTIKQ